MGKTASFMEQTTLRAAGVLIHGSKGSEDSNIFEESPHCSKTEPYGKTEETRSISAGPPLTADRTGCRVAGRDSHDLHGFVLSVF